MLTVSAETLVVPRHVLVYPTTSEAPRTANLNVPSIPSAPAIWLVFAKNVETHALDHVDREHNVALSTTHPFVLVQTATPETHSTTVNPNRKKSNRYLQTRATHLHVDPTHDATTEFVLVYLNIKETRIGDVVPSVF